MGRIGWRGRVREIEVLEHPTDARRVDRPRRGPPDPDLERKLKIRRRLLFAVFGGVFAVGAFAATFGPDGYLDARRLRREQARMEQQLRAQSRRVQELRAAVHALRTDPLTRERIARERLGLARPGEMTFVFPEPEQGPGGRPAPRP